MLREAVVLAVKLPGALRVTVMAWAAMARRMDRARTNAMDEGPVLPSLPDAARTMPLWTDISNRRYKNLLPLCRETVYSRHGRTPCHASGGARRDPNLFLGSTMFPLPKTLPKKNPPPPGGSSGAFPHQ